MVGGMDRQALEEHMMKIGVPTHASDLFVWRGRQGIGWEYNMRRIWNEIHRGERTFCIRSNRTGEVKDFRLESKNYYGGEVYAYNFKSEDGIEVTIFAD
jgi:hypothetical protein